LALSGVQYQAANSVRIFKFVCDDKICVDATDFWDSKKLYSMRRAYTTQRNASMGYNPRVDFFDYFDMPPPTQFRRQFAITMTATQVETVDQSPGKTRHV
jgi:hypothetical protein